MIDYTEKIPNNVDLGSDRVLQRALEHWQPAYMNWWYDMGPSESHALEVYLRTAISVEPDGWAQFGYVRMPEYRWGIFLQPREADRQVNFGVHKGQAAWQEVPGEYRSTLRRVIVTQGDTEPASVEQQRLLGMCCPSLVRSAQHFSGECGGRASSLGDGLFVASLFWTRRARRGGSAARSPFRRCGQSAHSGRVQRADAGLAGILYVHFFHRSRRKIPVMRAGGIGLRSAGAHLPIHADRRGAPYVRRARLASAEFCSARAR